MGPVTVLRSRELGILLGVVVATTAYGQQINVVPEKAPPPASVHRMVILEGPNRRVRYITTGNLTARDRAAAYELERAENQLSYRRDLQQLKQQYVNNERALEPRRHAINKQLYGTRIRYGGYGAAYSSPGAGGGYGYAGGYYGYPIGYFPFYNGGWGWGYGYPGGGVYASLGSSSYAETHSLQYGMGNEGRMKDALIQVIAHEASSGPAGALRDYQDTLTHAAASPILARDLGLATSTAVSGQPSFRTGGKATIWVGIDKYVGTVIEDRGDWVVLQTAKSQVTVRKSAITRAEVPSKP